MSRQPPSSTLTDDAVQALAAEHARFRQFLINRLGNESDADDVLQRAFFRALKSEGNLRRNERAAAWFYRILRNALADHHRTRFRRERFEEKWSRENEAASSAAENAAEWDNSICRCLHGLLPTLPARYATVLQRIDLNGEPRVLVAHDLKLSRASLDVVLHRARAALRQQLERFCGSCSREKCLACSCGSNSAKVV